MAEQPSENNRRKALVSPDGTTKIVIEGNRLTIQKPTPKGNWMGVDRYTLSPDRNSNMLGGENKW